MKINDKLHFEIEFKSDPSEEEKKKYPLAVSKVNYNTFACDRTISILDSEKDLFKLKNRNEIIPHVPGWVDFKLFRIYLIKL